MILIKDNCKFKKFHPAMIKVLIAVEEVWRDLKVNPTLTSANDGTHIPNSFHYSDRAYDLRVKNIPRSKWMDVRDRLAAILGNNYDVILENSDTPNAHIHIELDSSHESR